MKLMNRYNLVEFDMKDGDFEISMRSKQDDFGLGSGVMPAMPQAAPQYLAPQAPAPTPAAAAAPAPAAPAAAAPAPASDESKLIAIKSPMVGTFYRASSPDKPPFAKVGDVVKSGQVVCIIEAMKLFNEIESDVEGRIAKVLVEDAQPVEYDQVLFLVEPV